jgi:hypothetical protein
MAKIRRSISHEKEKTKVSKSGKPEEDMHMKVDGPEDGQHQLASSG